jgi:hypothetical protein
MIGWCYRSTFDFVLGDLIGGSRPSVTPVPIVLRGHLHSSDRATTDSDQKHCFPPRLWWFIRPVSVAPKSVRHDRELQTISRGDWRVWNRAPVVSVF